VQNNTEYNMIRPIAGLLTCLMAVGLGRAESAKEILEETGFSGGLIVHVGCGDGKLTADLYTNDRFVVQGLDREELHVEKARDHIRSKDLYGKVSAQTFDGVHLPYVDGLVNLVVVSGDDSQVSRGEILRVLAPHAALSEKGVIARLAN
jgi:SAM-dependent methyltransferase